MNSLNLKANSPKTNSTIKPNIEVFLATPEYAAETAAMFNKALGLQGIAAPGHEPYPDPSLFTEEGILENIASEERNLFIVTVDGTVAGGMIVDNWSPYNCENNCMAIAGEFRGLGLGSRLVEASKAWLDSCSFRNNITECVTHNMLSQSSHKSNGYEKILGLGYAHYPCVFFPDHPESVIWQGQLHGLIARELPYLRKAIPDIAKKTKQEILQALETLQYPPLLLFTPEDKYLTALLLGNRTLYVPQRYENIASNILKQYESQLSYTIKTLPSGSASPLHDNFQVDLKPDYAWTYITFPNGFSIERNKAHLEAELKRIKSLGKRYIQCRIEANHPSAIATGEFLQAQGFVFHSLLPLYTIREKDREEDVAVASKETALINTAGNTNTAGVDSDRTDNAHKQIQDFNDLLVLQWIHDGIINTNPLPGQTGSVIQLHGYPYGLSGEIVKLIISELAPLNNKPAH